MVCLIYQGLSWMTPSPTVGQMSFASGCGLGSGCGTWAEGAAIQVMVFSDCSPAGCCTQVLHDTSIFKASTHITSADMPLARGQHQYCNKYILPTAGGSGECFLNRSNPNYFSLTRLPGYHPTKFKE